MSKTAFIFPGQGAQYVGMAKDIYDHSAKARELIEQAEDKMKFSLSKVMFEGPLDELKLTSNTQPAIFLHSILLLNEISEYKIDAVAGHSLGEYSALVANKTLQPLDAFTLVRKRGEAMLAAGEKYQGTMAAVIGMKSKDLVEVCSKASEKGIVQCANFNSPGQIVISGSVEGVKEAMFLAKENGAKIVKELVVSGAFHSPLMKPAIDELKESLENTEFSEPTCPVYTNVKAEPTVDTNKIKKLLLEQLTAPVKWQESMEQMIKDGITNFVEIGPGKVLQGLAKRIDRNVSVKNIEKLEGIENIF